MHAAMSNIGTVRANESNQPLSQSVSVPREYSFN